MPVEVALVGGPPGMGRCDETPNCYIPGYMCVICVNIGQAVGLASFLGWARWCPLPWPNLCRGACIIYILYIQARII